MSKKAAKKPRNRAAQDTTLINARAAKKRMVTVATTLVDHEKRMRFLEMELGAIRVELVRLMRYVVRQWQHAPPAGQVVFLDGRSKRKAAKRR